MTDLHTMAMAAHGDATGTFTGASWEHALVIEGRPVRNSNGDIMFCPGMAQCENCLAGIKAASEAENHGTEALAALQRGDFAAAVKASALAAHIEREWGDDPIWGVFLWGVFAAAVEAAANEAAEQFPGRSAL